MICEVTSGAIHSALNILTSVTNPRSFSVEARNILLKACDGKLRMSSTDMYVWMQYDVDANVQEIGSVVVPAREFQALVNNLPDIALRLQTQPHQWGLQFLIEFATGKYRLLAYDGNEFPQWEIFKHLKALEDTGAVYGFEIDTAKLASAMRKVMFVASMDLSQGVYAGVHLQKDADTSMLDVVATDGYRLAKITLQAVDLPELTVTIPARSLKHALPLLEKFSPMMMVVDSGVVGWLVDTCEIYFRPLGQHYVAYQRVIPQQWAGEVAVNRDAMLTTLRRMWNVLNADTRTKLKRVELELREYDLTITAQTTLDGSGYETVGQEHLKVDWRSEPSEFRVALQCRYLLEFFNVVRDTNVVLCLQDDPTRPVLFYPASDPSFIYLVMPLQPVAKKD